MPPKKKSGKKGKSAACRIDELEAKFDLILAKLDQAPDYPANRDTQQNGDQSAITNAHQATKSDTSAVGSHVSRETERKKTLRSPSVSRSPARARPGARIRSSTPRHRQLHEAAHSSTPPHYRNRMYTSADILNSPDTNLRAKQIINLLNPQFHADKGNVLFDPYLHRTAR